MEQDSIAKHLSEKLDFIANSFNIAESTFEDVAKQLEENKQKLKKDVVKVEDIDANKEHNKLIIQISTLEEDFNDVRTGIKNTIKDANALASSISQSLVFEGAVDSEAVTAYASLLGVINQSMKLVMGTYTDLMKIQESIKKFDVKEETKGKPNISNTFIAVNTADIISQKFNKEDKRKEIEEIINVEVEEQ